MTIRWRELLDHIGVQWSTSSRYAGRDWLGIACPWCGAADSGFHLGINEDHGGYHCLRHPDHRGRSPYYLLHRLGVRRGEIAGLLTRFGGVDSGRIDTPLVGDRPPVERDWQRLRPATTNPAALAYLATRHFTEPARTASEFDLRIGAGKWAGRVWFKLTDLAGAVTGMTGRAMDEWRQPRYYTSAAVMGLYLPRLPQAQHRLAVVVEGPIDALRLADVTRRRNNLLVVALCGLTLSSHKLMQLVAIAHTVPRFALALDRTVWAAEANRLGDELRALPALHKLTRLPMPADHDDPGAMTNNQIEQWLGTFGRSQ